MKLVKIERSAAAEVSSKKQESMQDFLDRVENNLLKQVKNMDIKARKKLLKAWDKWFEYDEGSETLSEDDIKNPKEITELIMDSDPIGEEGGLLDFLASQKLLPK